MNCKKLAGISPSSETTPIHCFFDAGAIVYYLKAIPWQVPDFSVEKYFDKVAEIHNRIEEQSYIDVHIHLLIAWSPVGRPARLAFGTSQHQFVFPYDGYPWTFENETLIHNSPGAASPVKSRTVVRSRSGENHPSRTLSPTPPAIIT